MARFTEASKQAVIDSIDPLAVAGDYLRMEKKGGRFWGLCPFHSEKTPSFTVDPDRKYYYCFGCHKGGSIIDFVMEMEKMSFPEAIETLAKRFNVPLVYEKGSSPSQDKSGQTEALIELYRRVSMSFHHILMNKNEGIAAKHYIENRGINISTIEMFNLGFAPADKGWLYRFLSEKGSYSPQFLASTGLFSKRYPQVSFFTRRLMFPIKDKSNRVIAFGGRLLEGEGPKYLNSPDSDIFKKGRTLFGVDLALNEIRSSKQVYLAEGYMDVIALHQGGVSNAVAPLGTAFTDEQAKFLRRFADKVNLMLDNDEAGLKAAIKAIYCCRKNGLECSVINTALFFKDKSPLPKDPAEILQKFGAEALKNSLKCSILDIDFIIGQSRVFKDTAQAVAFMFPYLDALSSEVAKDTSIRAIAEAFGIEYRAVWDDYNRTNKQTTNNHYVRDSEAFSRKKVLRPGDELYLLGTVFVNPGLFKLLRRTLAAHDLEDNNARELYIILEDWYRQYTVSGDHTLGGEHSKLIDMISAGDLREFILRQLSQGAFANPEKFINDGIQRIKDKRLERRRREIIRELKNSSLQAARQADLLAEKVHIDAELKGRSLTKQATQGAE